MKDVIVEIAIAAIVFGYFGYGLVKTVKSYISYQTNLQQYLDNHKDAEIYKRPFIFTVFIACLSILCVVLGAVSGLMVTEQVAYYRIAYWGIAILFAGIVFESYMKRQVCFTEEGFFLDGNTFRYRMVKDFKIRKGVVRNVKIQFADGREVEVPRRLGYEVEKRYEAWKENRKQK
jgi:hypothetical protein